MKLVIEIPECDYERIKEYYDALPDGGEVDAKIVYIAEGTALPKGHGRIVDESKITKCEKVGIIIKDGSVIPCITTNAPTLIERSR